jgi:hypothetical protein
MLKSILLCLLLCFAACGDRREADPDRSQSPARTGKAGVPRVAPDEPVFRYDRIVVHRDTTHLFRTTPDKLLTYRYNYVAHRLVSIDVYDFSDQTTENLLDFIPRRYSIPVSSRSHLPPE